MPSKDFVTVSGDRDVRNPKNLSFQEREKELEAQRKAEEEAEEEAKNSPFRRWTQYNLEHTKEIMWLQMKHPKAAAILTFLVDQMDRQNAVMCSYKVLEEVLEVCTETIRKSIKVLKDNGYIAVLKSGSSNIYAVNDNVYWKAYRKNLMYSKFPANVVLALSEQEKVYQEKIKLKTVIHKEIEVKEKPVTKTPGQQSFPGFDLPEEEPAPMQEAVNS